MSETTNPNATTWLTQEAYDRLQSELEQLVADRPLVSGRIESAREEGDLRENGGYHAAKEEQGKQEARIRYIEDLLRNAKVGEAPAATDGTASPGMLVTVRFAGEDDPETFLLGSREDRIEGHPIYSPSSPLGHAVLGKGAGQVVQYTAPRGATMKVEIIAVKPFST